jgi:hypothetical protein
MPGRKELTDAALHVAVVLHVIAARRCKSLQHNENACNILQHEDERAWELSL